MNKKSAFIILLILAFSFLVFDNYSFAQEQCQLTQATWSSTATVHIGESRTLTVTGQGCSGLNVSFDIYELDRLISDYLKTVNSSFNGNTAVATYTFTNADFVQGGNEYIGESVYFQAKVFNVSGGVIDTKSSIDIVFLNTPPPGTVPGSGEPGGPGPGRPGGPGPGGPSESGFDFNIENPIGAGSLVDLAKAIGRFLFQIAIPIAVIVIIYAGLLFLTSGGNQEKVKKAKTALLYAVVGLAIILIGQGFFTLIKSILNLGQ